MKKLVLSLLIAVATVATAVALPPTETQVKNYKTQIQSYLRSEGYAPSIDSDGDISFKYQGDGYWIRVSSYDDGYCVDLWTMKGCKSFRTYDVWNGCNNVMSQLKYVRLYTTNENKTVIIEYEWFCPTISDFKLFFNDALLVITTADTRLQNFLNDK